MLHRECDEVVFAQARESAEKNLIGLANAPGKPSEKAQQLMARIDESIERVSCRADANKRKAMRVKVSALILTAATATVLGLDIEGMERWLKYAGFLFSLGATVLGTIEPYFNYRGLWVQHERAEFLFRLLRDDLVFYMGGTAEEDIETEKLMYFHCEFQRIWSDLSEDWLDQRVGERYSE